ncbi:MAG: hypothetical protein AB8B84_07695 [Granulosicoccus sp.]
MIDQVKRNTLKRIGLTTATVAAGAVGSHTFANASSYLANDRSLSDVQSLADIRVSTRVSSVTNDLEVLIKNIGPESATITQLTPSVTLTKRGQFDFGQLLRDGDVVLAPGQSLSVPMKPHAVAFNAADSASGQARTLTDALRRSFSVITDNEAFARVEVSDSVQFV